MSCEETFKECQANRSARIDAALANPANLGKANRVLADELGVSDKAVARHIAAMNATTVANDDKPKGYDPAIQTGRVQEFVGLWKQMDPDEQDHVIRLIVGYKQGKRIT